MENITFYEVAVYVGILGLLCITFSFLSGLRIIKIKAKYRLHKRVGIIGFGAVIVHGLTMLYYSFLN
jgi:DMSO/TMAO reductase YedYZ heme-binding membrane subunit